ncbi:patatin-like phospholipase family protein [Roseomonas sp. WA12]
MTGRDGRGLSLLLSGGIALGAYEAGVYAALAEAGGPLPDWLLGASAGAINAAIIAGNPPEQRVAQLRRFWDSTAHDPTPWTSFWLGPPPASGAWRSHYNQLAALQSLLLGRPGLFAPRRPGAGEAPALFDLEPLRRRLPDCTDFERINHPSAPRLTVVATDVVAGERVVFDTAHGARIGPDHVLASSALLPVFAPVEVEGRLLADGGFSSNLPLDLVLDEPEKGERLCILVELFARRGSVPRSLGASIARAGDLGFGNQTRRILDGCAREFRMRDVVRRLGEHLPPALREDSEVAPLLAEGGERALTVLLLGYRAALDEAGPGKAFDFSEATVAERWQSGLETARKGLALLGGAEPGSPLAPGLVLHEVEG